MKISSWTVAGVVILCLALGGATWLATGRPHAPTEPDRLPIPIVRVLDAAPGNAPILVRTHGTVVPAVETELVAEVGGRIVGTAETFSAGHFVRSGEVLLEIDPRDYRIAVEDAKAAVARWQSQRRLAEQNLHRLQRLEAEGIVSSSLLDDAVSRAEVARAQVRQASVRLERATLDLERTKVVAPFAGRVSETMVEIGRFVARATPVARVYGIDHAEVRLPVSDRDLAVLGIPFDYRNGEGVETTEIRLRALRGADEHVWKADLDRVEGWIDSRSRMAYIVARVADPFRGRGPNRGPPLAIGSFVEAEIRGPIVRGILLPRGVVRGDRTVVVVDSSGRIRERLVEVFHSDREHAVVTAGLEPLDRISWTFSIGHPVGTLVEPAPFREAGP